MIKDQAERYSVLTKIICLLLLILIAYSLVVRVRMYMLGISLWNDEALLVEHVVNSSFKEMLLLPQTTPRTEPILYLFTVKGLTMLFGISESVLRVYSFAALIVTLIVQGLLLRKAFRVSMVFTLFSVAVSSTFLYYMQYSHEFRPYMGDAAFVLIVLFAYYAYRNGAFGRGLRAALLLALIFSACLLFSSPSAFAAFAVLATEFLIKCYRKDRLAALFTAISGAVFLVVFAVNYLLWLRPIATDADMLNYWEGYNFSLGNISIVGDLLEPVWPAVWIILPFSIFGFVISLIKRNVYTLSVGIFLILLLAASAIDKYPIVSRLWLFLYAIIFIYVYVFIDTVRVSIEGGKAAKAVQAVVPLILAAVILVPNLSFAAYGRGEEQTLSPGNQANPIIAYVEENIREGETLYAVFTTDVINNVLRYKIGYDVYRIGNVSSDNIIFGTDKYREDVELIAETGDVYLFFYHSYYPLSKNWYIDYIVKELQKRGFVEQIMNVHHTYLYWFTDDLAKVRASANFDISNLDTEGGRLSGTAFVENTGETILAPEKPGDFMTEDGGRDPDRTGRLYVVLFKADGRLPSADIEDGIILGEFISPVLPGETAEIQLRSEGIEPGSYQIELVSFGKYSFGELGTKPIPISVK